MTMEPGFDFRFRLKFSFEISIQINFYYCIVQKNDKKHNPFYNVEFQKNEIFKTERAEKRKGRVRCKKTNSNKSDFRRKVT